MWLFVFYFGNYNVKMIVQAPNKKSTSLDYYITGLLIYLWNILQFVTEQLYQKSLLNHYLIPSALRWPITRMCGKKHQPTNLDFVAAVWGMTGKKPSGHEKFVHLIRSMAMLCCSLWYYKMPTKTAHTIHSF